MEQFRGYWCPACAGTGWIPPLPPLTEADCVARANGWGLSQAAGYLDGQRDKQRGVKAALPPFEMTDYAHGYWQGWKDALRSAQGEG